MTSFQCETFIQLYKSQMQQELTKQRNKQEMSVTILQKSQTTAIGIKRGNTDSQQQNEMKYILIIETEYMIDICI